jgi:hypothetical protein
VANAEEKKRDLFPALLFVMALIIVATVLGASVFALHLLPEPKRHDAAPSDSRLWQDAELTAAQITETLAVVRLAQFTAGMLVGVFLLCLGAYFSWVGVREKIGLDLQGGENLKAGLTALGPGMVLAVCGTFVVIACLMKDFRYSERGGFQGSQPSGQPAIPK